LGSYRLNVTPKAYTGTFPLSIADTGRYFQSPNGKPFFIHGQSLWELEVQPTRAQVDQILNLLTSQGFNALVVETFEHLFSNQSPPYLNVEGNAPFTMSGSTPPYTVDFSTMTSAYWNFLDYIIDGCNSRGILVVLMVCYWGFQGTQEGWSAELTAETQAHRISYGVNLATRYRNRPNILYTLGGDNPNGATQFADIASGLLSVNPHILMSGHSSRGTDGFASFGSIAGFNVNTQYSNNAGIVADAATCYARNIVFFLIENEYENATSQTNQTQRCQAYQSLLGGAAGHLFGGDPYWSLGQDNSAGLGGISVATAITNYGNTTATQHQAFIKQLWTAFAWWKLVPQTPLSGTGVTAITWGLATDGSFAPFYTPAGAAFTATMTNITHASVRARWYDPTNGTFATDAASPLSNTGTHLFTPPGLNAAGDADLVLVLD
jgi:hypothetical protein